MSPMTGGSWSAQTGDTFQSASGQRETLRGFGDTCGVLTQREPRSIMGILYYYSEEIVAI